MRREIRIVKTIENGIVNYTVQPDQGMDVDEVVGILTRMIGVVGSQGPLPPKDKHKPDYCG